MNSFAFWRPCIWLGAAALSMLTFSVSADTLSEAERQAKLAQLKQTIEHAQQELQKIKTDRSSLESNLQQSESKIGELSKKVNELKSQLEDKQSHLQTLRSEKEALSSVKKQQQDSVEQHVNAAYRLGQQSQLKMVLNQQDPATVSRNLKYYNYLMTAQAEKIEGFVNTIERLNTIEPEIVQTLASLSSDQTELQNERQQLLKQQAERKHTLQKLESTIASKGGQLQALNDDRRNLEQVVQQVQTIVGVTEEPMDLSPDVPFAQLKGKLPWPTRGKVLRSYGSARVANKVSWQGVLIGATEGNPVYAVHHGQVVFSDYLRGQGLLLIIDHGDGFMSLYAHNQALYKKLGDHVKGGEQVGAVGLSGGQTQAGLYFEMRYKGEPTNPQVWLKKAV
jgi:murein hydrolase activator